MPPGSGADTTTMRYEAICQTGSYGANWKTVERCGHLHRTGAAAGHCCLRWERREQRIAQPYIDAGLEVSRHVKYITRMAHE